MSELKSILLHLDASAAAPRRLRIAHRLGAAHGTRIDAMYAVMPLPLQYPFAFTTDGQVATALGAYEEQAQGRARTAVEAECRALGATGIRWLEAGGDALEAFRREAFAYDLLVLGQYQAPQSNAPPGVPPDFVASVLVASGKPALVLPYIEVGPEIGHNVLVAWKPTAESARAVTAALPILQRARQVHVTTWDEAAERPELSPPIEQYLRHHGVKATLHRGGPVTSVGELLLSRAADLGADLLVMGCYGHSRAREWVLGGATRTVLKSMTLPVLMAH